MIMCSFMLKAQSVSFGVKGGLNVASVKVKNTETNYDPRISAHVGGLAHVHLSKQWALQPELVFSGQGFKAANDEVYRMNYVNVPILVQYMFDNGFRLQTGPQVGFLVAAKRKLNDVTVDIKDNYKGVAFDWSVGAGYLIPKTGVGFDARFNFGIAKLNDNNLADNRSGVLQVGMFYLFNQHWK
ncbi:MAG: porin family protein [Bacteroidota bacterium]